MESKEIEMIKKEFLLSLQRYRHNYLNHMQMLRAYLELGQLESAQRQIDLIVTDAYEEGKVMNIDDVHLAYYLLIKRLHCEHIQLDIEIDMDGHQVHEIGHKYPQLAEQLDAVLAVLEHQCVRGMENYALIYIEGTGDFFHVTVEFEGYCRLTKQNLWHAFQHREVQVSDIHTEHKNAHDDEVSIKIKLI